MSYQWFIGIDVSKQTLDITILNNNEKKMYEQIINSDQSVKSFLKKLSDQKIALQDCLFCLEHTGIYNTHFLKVMEERKLAVCLESSLAIVGVPLATHESRRLVFDQRQNIYKVMSFLPAGQRPGGGTILYVVSNLNHATHNN